MIQELQKNFKIVVEKVREAGLPTETLERTMAQMLGCLNGVPGEDERVVLLTEMLILIKCGLTFKLDDEHHRIFNTDIGLILTGCIMTLIKEFSHGDLS